MNLPKNEIQRNIYHLIHPKRFGRINRSEIWWVLYEKGVRAILLRNIVQRHGGDTLRGQHDGKLGRELRNNGGISWRPHTRLIHHFSDGFMDGYKQEPPPPGNWEIWQLKILTWQSHGQITSLTNNKRRYK